MRRGATIAALAIFALAAVGDDGEELRILFPKDGATLAVGEFDIICALPDGETSPPPLSVDGEAAEWQTVLPPGIAAQVKLAPGKHRIVVGKAKLVVRVLRNGGKKPVLRSHADEKLGHKTCADCHEIAEQEGAQRLQDADEPDACLKCHSSEAFELAHFHPLDPIAACHDCHALHGSEDEKLLKGPVQELCAACHE